jgi:hypothetical protein
MNTKVSLSSRAYLIAVFILVLICHRSSAQINYFTITLHLWAIDDDPGFSWSSEDIDDIVIYHENYHSSDDCG